MPLKMKFEDGQFKPFVVCDHCGEAIADAKRGNYQWRVDEQGRCTDDNSLCFTHKTCCRPFEAAKGGRLRWSWAPLSCLPVFLAKNMSLDLKEAEKVAAQVSSL